MIRRWQKNVGGSLNNDLVGTMIKKLLEKLARNH
jgi:hypothetical protein